MAGGLGYDGGQTIVLPPLDLAYMAATLLHKGHHVRIIDSDTENRSPAILYKSIQEEKPDVVIATVSLVTLHGDCSFARTCANTDRTGSS